MMKKGKKSLSEKLIYNNKFVMLVSVVMAVAIWVSVKVNYSTEITRVVKDVRISLNTSMSEQTGYKGFIDEEELYVDVEISGKAYDINSNVIGQDDVIVTASEVYVDAAGSKLLSLSARVEGGKGGNTAQIVSVTPSQIMVYYDREISEEFSVEPRLTNDTQKLVDENYHFGGLAVTKNTVKVTGPEEILTKIDTVYLTATVDESELPLKRNIVLDSHAEFNFRSPVDPQYLKWIRVEGDTPAINVVVKAKKNIPTTIKYINNPSAYKADDANVKIDPANVTILGSAEASSSYFLVHTVDFSELSNIKNEFEYSIDEVQSKEKLSDETVESFRVTIDFSHLKSRKFNPDECTKVYVGENEGYNYDADFSDFENNEIIVIGPGEILSGLTAEDIKIEIDVENLLQTRNRSNIVEVSKISISDEYKADCWVYGTYTVMVSATPVPVVQAEEAVPVQ